MKKNIFKFMAAFLPVAIVLPLASCGDDDDEQPDDPQPKYARVAVNYSISLSEDYYNLWDIQVTYTDYAGSTKSETVTQDWSRDYTYDANDEVPTEYSIVVKGLPKNPVPTVDQEKVYTLEADCMMTITGITADGKSEILGATPSSSKLSVRGDHLTDRLANGINIASGSYTISL